MQSGYVLFWEDKQIKENYQHPSLHGRVELQYPEMKDRDASVILKNVNINDTGTYECSIREKNKTGKAKLISTIRLTVTVSGSNSGDVEEGNQINRNPTEENYKHHYALGAAFVLLCLAAVGLAVGWKYKRHTEQKPEQPDADEEGVSLSQVVQVFALCPPHQTPDFWGQSLSPQRHSLPPLELISTEIRNAPCLDTFKNLLKPSSLPRNS